MIKIFLVVLFVIVVAAFCTLNRQEISLRYFFGWHTGSFPLYLLILISLVAGIVVGFAVGWGERWKLRVKARNLGDQVQILKEEVETPVPKEESLPEPSPKTPEVEKSPFAGN